MRIYSKLRMQADKIERAPWYVQRVLTWTRNMLWHLRRVGRWPWRYVRLRRAWWFARQCEFDLRYDWWPGNLGFRHAGPLEGEHRI